MVTVFNVSRKNYLLLIKLLLFILFLQSSHKFDKKNNLKEVIHTVG